MCCVDKNRSIVNCRRLNLTDKHLGFDVQLVGNATRLAAALANGSVALFRLETNSFVQLLSYDPFVPIVSARPRNPLFFGNTLLVRFAPASYYNSDEIFTFSMTYGNGHTTTQIHNCTKIELQGAQCIRSWYFMNGELIVLECSKKLVYNAV